MIVSLSGGIHNDNSVRVHNFSVHNKLNAITRIYMYACTHQTIRPAVFSDVRV